MEAKLIGALLGAAILIFGTASITHKVDQAAYLKLKDAQLQTVQDAKDAASKAQKQADANLLKQKQDALDAANQAVAAAQSREASRVHTISTLEARIKANEQDKGFAQWNAIPIDSRWLAGLCFPNPDPTPACDGHTYDLPAASTGGPVALHNPGWDSKDQWRFVAARSGRDD